MNNTISTGIKVLGFLAIGFTILWLLYHSLNTSFQEDCALRGVPANECSLLEKVWTDLKSARVNWLIVITCCFFLSNIIRASRWRQFTSSLGYTTRFLNNFHCIMLGYFANLGFPRIGEVVRAGTFAKYEKIPFEKVMGTVVLDRVLDLICFGSVFILALCLQFDLLWNFISENASIDIVSIIRTPWFLTFVAIILMSLIVCIYYWESLKKLTLVRKLYSMVMGFVDGLSSISKVKNLPLVVFNSLAIWTLYYLMTYLCFNAFQATAGLGPLAGLMVFVFGSLGMIIPSPGGMGTYHALVMAALAIYGISLDDAFSFAMIIFFTINIFGNILFGIVALFLLPGFNQNYQPERR